MITFPGGARQFGVTGRFRFLAEMRSVERFAAAEDRDSLFLEGPQFGTPCSATSAGDLFES
jgi:hypothetical protein